MSMMDETMLSLSGVRFSVRYAIVGSECEAQAAARLVAIDQTVEAPDEIIPAAICEHMLGRIEEFEKQGARYQATISFPVELLGTDCVALLLSIFGISSLRAGIQVIEMTIPERV